MKRFPQPKLHLDQKDLKTDLGKGNKIFVGSSTDMFAVEVPDSWILQVLSKCYFHNNHYFFQTKNVERFKRFESYFQELDCSLGTTIETNRLNLLVEIGDAPINRITKLDYVSIEPIMDFDLEDFVRIIKAIHPTFVSIGADSRNSKLPEPSKEKVQALIKELSKFTIIKRKDNLKRLL